MLEFLELESQICPNHILYFLVSQATARAPLNFLWKKKKINVLYNRLTVNKTEHMIVLPF